jgi:hypothetical protein
MARFSSLLKFMCFRGIDEKPSTKDKKPKVKPAAAPAVAKEKAKPAPVVVATSKRAGGRRAVNGGQDVSTYASSVIMSATAVVVCMT